MTDTINSNAAVEPTTEEVVASPEAAPSAESSPCTTGHQILIVNNADEEDDDGEVRVGSISSARFNILSTMVGGGCLSLPLAFQQSGNALVGPLLLLVIGLITDFCFRLLVASAIKLNPPRAYKPGKDSFESVSSAAFGAKAYVMSMGLVTAMCVFGAVGYSVLLRDMMEPINDQISFLHQDSSSWLHKNFTMFLVILVVTPTTTLQTLTALKNCGAASMLSVLILGSCIVFRSVQCNINDTSGGGPWYSHLTFFPESPRDLLDAFPLYISCFVCHYNIHPVHNELRDPSPKRVSWWLRSTAWYAFGLYLVMGFAGSSYGHCTATGKVQGNVLLDFDENDPLLMVGRMCLALTITLAFPMLVIPARDILLRSVILPFLRKGERTNASTATPEEPSIDQQLQEPLLTADEEEVQESSPEEQDTTLLHASFGVRLLTSIAIFWTAGAVASCVESIDIVWDLLGSSLSILLSYLIPCGSYLVIMKDTPNCFWSKTLCWILIVVFFPLMIISTANAVDNTFSK
jgi:amino acid permease